MPFTFSHPAILLPFVKRKKISITGLVIGSMAPDLEFFFRMRTQSEISHTFHGLLLIDLPLAIIITLLFHGLLKKSLLYNSPNFIQKRVALASEINWFHYFNQNRMTVVICFFIGAFSHFLLDSISHWDGYVVQLFPSLTRTFIWFPIYDWIQYGTSIIGLIVLGIFFFKLPQYKIQSREISISFWVLSLLLTVVTIYLRFNLVVGWHSIADMIIGCISSAVIALTISSLLYNRSRNF